jgi:hypothetical protein
MLNWSENVLQLALLRKDLMKLMQYGPNYIPLYFLPNYSTIKTGQGVHFIWPEGSWRFI